MQITNRYGYNTCISVAARLQQVAATIDAFDTYDEDTISEDEYKNYIMKAEALIEELAKIMASKAKSYIAED